MYLGQFVSDLSKRGLQIKLRVFLQKSNENLIIEHKPFVLWSIKHLNILGDTVKLVQELKYIMDA